MIESPFKQNTVYARIARWLPVSEGRVERDMAVINMTHEQFNGVCDVLRKRLGRESTPGKETPKEVLEGWFAEYHMDFVYLVINRKLVEGDLKTILFNSLI